MHTHPSIRQRHSRRDATQCRLWIKWARGREPRKVDISLLAHWNFFEGSTGLIQRVREKERGKMKHEASHAEFFASSSSFTYSHTCLECVCVSMSVVRFNPLAREKESVQKVWGVYALILMMGLRSSLFLSSLNTKKKKKNMEAYFNYIPFAILLSLSFSPSFVSEMRRKKEGRERNQTPLQPQKSKGGRRAGRLRRR